MLVEEKADRCLKQYIEDKSMSDSKVELEVGDWIMFNYGFNPSVFYVFSKADNKYLLGKRSWLVSSSDWFSGERIFADKSDFTYLGRGKKRWWRCLFPFINDFICPFSKPKGVFIP